MIEASSSYPLANALWTMFVFFAWVIWIWMLITIYSDLFRRHDVSGWAKGAWTVFLLVVPFIGVFVYLISQGGKMGEREAARQQAVMSRYAAAANANGAGNGQVSQISQAKDLLDSGAITDDEFQALKAKALAT